MTDPPGAAAPLSVAFVVPCFNEESSIPEFYRRGCATAVKLWGCEVRFIFVDDGSTDATAQLLDDLAAADPKVTVLHLARNMGHQIALTAGLDFASADVVITIDVDLQDPPELAEELLAKIREGFDVVHARRRARAGEPRFKLATAWIFYRLLGSIAHTRVIPDSGDFRAVTRPAIDVARRFREPHRFLRALFAGVGFRQAVVWYDRVPRFAGQTKYPLAKMVKLALDAIFNHSAAPLQFIGGASLLAWAASLIYLAKALYEHFVLGITVAGWTSLVLLLSLFAGLQLTAMAALGSYVSRIFEQGQRRPLYWLSDARNLDLSGTATNSPEHQLSLGLVRQRRELERALAVHTAPTPGRLPKEPLP